MRLVPILLMMFCCSASAEWLLFSKADNGDKHYIDVSTMQTNKHLVSNCRITPMPVAVNHGAPYD